MFRKIFQLYNFLGLLYKSHDKILKLKSAYPENFIDLTTRFEIEDLDKFKLGQGAYIAAYNFICVGNDPRSPIKNSWLSIGSNTYIGEFNNIRAAGGSIEIGENCLISQHVSIIAANHSIRKEQTINSQPWDTNNNFIKIEDDVWIGCGVQILPGVTIGRGAVIAAGSLVNKSVEAYAIVAGVPAKKIRER